MLFGICGSGRQGTPPALGKRFLNKILRSQNRNKYEAFTKNCRPSFR